MSCLLELGMGLQYKAVLAYMTRFCWPCILMPWTCKVSSFSGTSHPIRANAQCIQLSKISVALPEKCSSRSTSDRSGMDTCRMTSRGYCSCPHNHSRSPDGDPH
eukprot:5369597-Amphidinium_carterae.3